ncbi:MAG: pyruvate carboxyltransferase [Holophagaceae bacterium]|nr:pyruvate carboxyltransferase [Holophagaceae bacterium]
MLPEFPRLDFQAPGFDPARIWITDSTFREGLQAMAPISTEQATTIFGLISRIGGPEGLIRESDFFVHTPAQRERMEACLDLGLEFPKTSLWIRASAEDVRLVRPYGGGRVSVVMPCSDLQIREKLGFTRVQAIQQYMSLVATLLGLGFAVRCSMEDITRADIRGFAGPVMESLAALGGNQVSFRLCDTLGLGMPMEGAGLQRSVPTLIRCLREDYGISGEALEWHGHNDFHMAVANSVACWVAGASGVNGSFLGLGERSGIAPLEALVLQAYQLKGAVDPEAMTAIVALRDYMKAELGVSLERCYPILGEEYLNVRSGIHADGLEKNREAYYPFDAEGLLGAPLRPVITDLSGLAGLAAWVRNTGRQDPRYRGKKDERLLAMKREIDLAYTQGRTLEFTASELEALYERHFRNMSLHAAS